MVTLLNKDNDQLSIGIDVHTHLPISKRYSWRDPDKYKVEDETIYGNYRKVQGIETPYTITNKRDGEMTGQSFLSHAEYNTTFAPGFFDATVTYDPETYHAAKTSNRLASPAVLRPPAPAAVSELERLSFQSHALWQKSHNLFLQNGGNLKDSS